jgi:adenylyltransferase/sulfurtransferase
MFEEYFSRQITLWGEDTQKSLQTKKVAIVGAGGLGSSLAYALGCSGIGDIDIIDFDTISYHNIHRQIAYSLEDIDKPKAHILASKIKAKNPFVQVTGYDMGFDEFAQKNHKQYDLILDATDNVEARAFIDSYAKDTNTPWVYGSVEEFMGQVCLFDESSFEAFNSSTHQASKGITAPMVMHIASLQANLALRYLAGLVVKKDVLYYIYFNKEGELITQKFNMPKRK